jgi:hypothetical protein
MVDLGVVRFLILCEDEGMELVECPPCVSELMLRERAEEGWLGQPTQPHGNLTRGGMPSLAGCRSSLAGSIIPASSQGCSPKTFQLAG